MMDYNYVGVKTKTIFTVFPDLVREGIKCVLESNRVHAGSLEIEEMRESERARERDFQVD